MPIDREQMIVDPTYETNGKPLEQAISKSVARAVHQGAVEVLEAEAYTADNMPKGRNDASADGKTFEDVYAAHKKGFARTRWNSNPEYRREIVTRYDDKMPTSV